MIEILEINMNTFKKEVIKKTDNLTFRNEKGEILLVKLDNNGDFSFIFVNDETNLISIHPHTNNSFSVVSR